MRIGLTWLMNSMYCSVSRTSSVQSGNEKRFSMFFLDVQLLEREYTTGSKSGAGRSTKMAVLISFTLFINCVFIVGTILGRKALM